MPQLAAVNEEKAQSRARFIICWISLAGFLVVSKLKGPQDSQVMTHGLATILSYLVFSTAWYGMVRRWPDRWPARRNISLAADLGIMTVFFHLGDGAATTYYPLFLWIIIGNGIRFGEKYLWRGIVLGAAGFASVLVFNPFWRGNLEVGLGLLLGVVVLPVFYQGALRRLRVLHQLQIELAQSRLAEQAKGRFLAAMSHELRTPMNGVLGVAEALKATDLDAEQQNQVDIIGRSIESLLHTVSDILDYSRMTGGEVALGQVEFDLWEVLGDVERLLTHSAADRGIALELEYPPDIPRRFKGDPARIRQMAFHLVGNGVKFTEQGEVRIRVRFVGQGQGPNVRIEVVDTGVGIPAHRLGAIVAGFEQADNSNTRKHGGVGLGLALTSRLADLMGGGLTVESREGKGSTFTLSLKLTPVAESVSAKATAPEPAETLDTHFGLRGLVVEDNKVNQFVIRKLLGMIGIEVEMAGNGAEALQMLDENSYDIVFMDIRMPVMNGFEATRHIRARQDETARIPIIAVTADASDQVERECYAVGMDAFLAKPLTAVNLAATISQLSPAAHPAVSL